MNPALEPELVEAFALAKSTVSTIHTIELRHESIVDPMYLVQGFVHRGLPVDGEEKVFMACAFDLQLPSTDDGGLQELNITIDNVGNRVSDFCQLALAFPTPVEIYYRPYLSNDLSKSMMDPPLRLFLLDVNVTFTQVSGRAVPVNYLNLTFPNEDYTRSRFPGLGTL